MRFEAHRVGYKSLRHSQWFNLQCLNAKIQLCAEPLGINRITRRENQHRCFSLRNTEPFNPQGQGHPDAARLPSLQSLQTPHSPFVIRKHKEMLNWMMRTFGLDTYG